MIFKNSDQLIARVSGQLKSFKAAGLLDEGDFYRWIKEVLGLLNIPAYSVVHQIAEFENRKMKIPKDMSQIWALWKYHEVVESHAPQRHYQGQVRTHGIVKECIDPCGDPCDIETVDSNLLVAKFYVDTIPQRKVYDNGTLLTLKNYKVDRCDKDSPSIRSRSTSEVTMDNQYFYFNFDSGSIYLQYFKYMLDENGLPMVPDVIKIELAIEKYIVFRFFQECYYNNVGGDVFQRKQDAEMEYTKAFKSALDWVRLPEARELLEYGKLLRNKYKIFEV